MKRFVISLAALAAASALGGRPIAARATDTTKAAAARNAGAVSDGGVTRMGAADSTARLVPVRLLSPGGVRIRSVRDNRRIVIIAPPTRVMSPDASPETAARAAAASRSETASQPESLTREDIDRLEARLRTYFDERIRGLEIAEREYLLSLYPREADSTRLAGLAGPAGPAGPPGPSGPPGGTGPTGATRVVVPVVAPTAVAPEGLAADSTRWEAAAAPADTAARDTRGAAFLEFNLPPPVTLLVPGVDVIEIERAMLAGELIRAVNVIFEFDSAELLPASLPSLSALGAVLVKHPEIRIEIGGHTDSRGPEEYNLRLSQARAEAVRRHLIAAFSIPGEKLVARGYGEAAPIADEGTPTGRMLNRRVEFRVLREGERRDAAPTPGE
jgi:outer membrane protein OmpA-like peptidoglycan-associated protein